MSMKPNQLSQPKLDRSSLAHKRRGYKTFPTHWRRYPPRAAAAAATNDEDAKTHSDSSNPPVQSASH